MTDIREPNPLPDDETAKTLRDAAEHIQPEPSFVAGLERRLVAAHPGPEVSAMFTMRKIAPVLLWVLAAAVMVVAISWAIRSIAPQPVPAAGKTPVSTQQAPAPPVDQSTPVPSSKSYEWRGSGTTLTLATTLPDGPSEAGIYAAKLAEHATIEDAMALAQRFGINGQAYKTPGMTPGTKDFIITDGRQSLGVQSIDSYNYTADIVRAYNNFSAVQSPRAEEVIATFLHSHGFTLPFFRVEWSDWRSGYMVWPLTGEGTPLSYERHSTPMLLLTLDENGNVASLRANIVSAASEPLGRYGILTAEEAFQKMLDPSTVNGMFESMNSVPNPMKQWRRSYPTDQTITIYGTARSEAAVQANQPAFIQIDGFPVIGQVTGLEQYAPPAYVQASGRFVIENGIEKFSIDSWKLAGANEDGLLGTLDRQDGQTILTTQEGVKYVLPDVPADMPVPFENAYVIGTAEGDLFQWKTIDNRMAGQGGGGGGGGGGGFYKLNLTGTPVPFPTASPDTSVTGGSPSGGTQYVVQAGDTLSKIAASFGISVDALVQANGIKDPGMLTIGQTLIIPDVETRKVEGLRGLLSITINKHEDGTQEVAYGFLVDATSNPSGYMLLEGNGLEALHKYNSRPVDIWGTLEAQPGGAIQVLKVDRFEIPFPDLKVQVLVGKQKITEIAGQPATLFIAEDGTTYVQLLGDGITGSSLIGKEGDQVQLECVAIPGETVDGHPALRVFGGMMAIDPKTGLHMNLPITMDQPHVVEMPSIGKPPEAPSMTIEKVELIHFLSDPRSTASAPSADPLYFQPVWRFSGHYSNGDEFEILIQALKQEYLLPEVEPALQPG